MARQKSQLTLALEAIKRDDIVFISLDLFNIGQMAFYSARIRAELSTGFKFGVEYNRFNKTFKVWRVK